ncbi:hypothetical protein OAH12_00220, partial [Cyclobacteriaceae bacterium]|nr:hypothetical protein [Cyclobacteriaceae bacterium]
KYNKLYRRRYTFTPYVLVGFGGFHYNPKTTLNGTTYKLRDYQTEGNKYSSISFSGQFGGGVRMKLTPHLNVSLEAVYKKTFTDYLDDVSTVYPNDIASWSDPTRQQLSLRQEGRTYDQAAGKQRGNPDRKDGYLLLGLRFDYTLKITRQMYNVRKNASRFRMHKGIKKR